MKVNDGTFEYKMSKEAAQAYLDDRNRFGSKEERKMQPQEYLCYVVNTNYGLLGNCREVIVD